MKKIFQHCKYEKDLKFGLLLVKFTNVRWVISLRFLLVLLLLHFTMVLTITNDSMCAGPSHIPPAVHITAVSYGSDMVTLNHDQRGLRCTHDVTFYRVMLLCISMSLVTAIGVETRILCPFYVC